MVRVARLLVIEGRGTARRIVAAGWQTIVERQDGRRNGRFSGVGRSIGKGGHQAAEGGVGEGVEGGAGGGTGWLVVERQGTGCGRTEFGNPG